MKWYLKFTINLLVSLFVIVPGTMSVAQAKEVWLDFSVPEADINAIALPELSPATFSTKPLIVSDVSPSSLPQLPGKNTVEGKENGVKSIALDFSVPKAETVIASVSGIPEQPQVKPTPSPVASPKLEQPQVKPTPSPAASPKPKQKTVPLASKKIVQIAMNRVGTVFKPKVSAQCAVFVRDVFKEAGIKLGVSQQPFDKAVQWIDAHPARAQSFFGADVGKLITRKEDLQPGDLVGFQNTYGNWKPGAITHVGIVVEPKADGTMMMVDRSTRSSPVQYRPLSTFKFAVGVRPYDNPNS